MERNILQKCLAWLYLYATFFFFLFPTTSIGIIDILWDRPSSTEKKKSLYYFLSDICLI